MLKKTKSWKHMLFYLTLKDCVDGTGQWHYFGIYNNLKQIKKKKEVSKVSV